MPNSVDCLDNPGGLQKSVRDPKLVAFFSAVLERLECLVNRKQSPLIAGHTGHSRHCKKK